MPPKAQIVEMTPQWALKILEKNTGNRNVRQTRVDTYAADMLSGNWKLNGSAIVLNGKGTLEDGQHRLLACVQSGKPFMTLLVEGVTADSQKTIDTGLARTMADVLRWSGEEYAAELAALLNIMWRHDDGSLLDADPVPSRAQLAAYLKANPTLRESVKAKNRVPKTLVRGTAMAGTHFLLAREHGVEIADLFLRRLAEGTDYAADDPLLRLREYATNVAASRTLRPTTIEWFAVCVKAANAWLLGRQVKNLRWRRIGPQREGFPPIVTREDVGDISIEEL